MENENYLTREEQKEIAIRRMKQLDIFQPYIKAFEKNNIVTFFENFAGFYATKENGEEELYNAIKRFEDETGSLVYAVTHEMFEFGECYSFLCVSKYREDEANTELEVYKNKFYVFCYVWNKSIEYCSEYGTIAVQSFGGGIRRVS